MLLLVTFSVPSRPVLKPQLIPKLQKSYKITIKTKVKVQVQKTKKLVTLFDSYSYDGVSAGIWVIHTGPKSGGELLTLFDSYS